MTLPKYKTFTNYKHFAEMRRKDEKLYWSPAVQMSMHSIAEKLGEKFFLEEEPEPTSSNTDYSSLTAPAVSGLDKLEKARALKEQIQTLSDALENLGTVEDVNS